jgi:2'-5' RNA ligase
VTDDELEALLEELETGLLKDVQGALDDTAQDFLYAVDRATELVAARFSVSGIRGMWRRRVGTIMNRLRSISGRAATVAAEDIGDRLPRGWDENLAQYTAATRALLNAVGDRLAAEASQSLAEGLNAGEGLADLKKRLSAVFAADGTQLGPGRAERIAMTEATRAFNAGTLAAAQALTGPDRPLVKQWVTRRDARVREAHADTNGQLQLLDEPFDVAGTPMQYPGDPTAPAALTVNCRCIMRTAVAEGNREVDQDDMSAADGQDFQSKMPAQLKRYWLTGEGAAKIGWGTPGSFDRCVSSLRDDFPQDPEGLCANLYHEATGKWPGQDRGDSGADVHTGAMLALMPTVEDAARLALEGGEAADQLHLTLFYLGDAVDWSEQQRGDLISRVAAAARYLKPVAARVFGGAQWNPTSDEPAWVWNVGDDLDQDSSRLQDAKYEITYALEDGHNDPELPQQYSPWAPHICAVYGPDDWGSVLADRVGPVTFDRVRVAFAGQYTDIPLTGAALGTLADVDYIEPADEVEYEQPPQLLTWSTPGATALAFENQQTGDGRVFAPGALYWTGGPWPLQYADEMNGGHDGARLAGAIFDMGRDGDRVAGAGVLYLTQQAGVEAAMLLSQGAPLGVSVDLDDVDVEMVDATGNGPQAPADGVYRAHLVTASLLPLPDGGWRLTGETDEHWTASASGTVGETSRVDIVVDADCTVPASAFEITAAAGDSDALDGVVVDRQESGQYLMRITRARVRGATLVSIPAYADARIVLDDMSLFAAVPDTVTAGAANGDYDRVVRHVRKSLVPVSASDAATFLKLPIVAVRRYLARASRKGEIVRIARGTYVKPAPAAAATTVAAAATGDELDGIESLTAAATGSVDLPVADRGADWDGDAAASRVFDWADGDTGKIGRAFAYRDDDADPATKAAYKLGYADVVDDVLTIIPRGVFAAQAAVEGARGGVDIPSDELAAVRDKLAAVRAHVDEVTGGDERDDMEASAWSAMRNLPAMPAAWFAAPTAEELPPGGPGVNYRDGRIFGWVAQAGEPHAGYAQRVTIDTLGRIDTTHFLRQRFTLDDGSTVKAGAFTMNVGHHRDGAECETSACQFDDTRTVAGIVTVGMSDRGMWFSGAAAPWMSDWDRSVFMATQPSYHMKKGPSGNWQLRAVLAVPVPGHSSPLLASAVVGRSNLALTAAATMAEVEEAVAAAEAVQAADELIQHDQDSGHYPHQAPLIDYDRLADALVAAMGRAEQQKLDEQAELEELLAEGRKLDGDTGTEGD